MILEPPVVMPSAVLFIVEYRLLQGEESYYYDCQKDKTVLSVYFGNIVSVL
jgi:hypothetical protein